MRGKLKRCALLVSAIVLLGTAGCANYWQYRWDDFHDIADIGVTFSKKGQWVFYNSFESILALGYGDYECAFYGLGGGHFGRSDHYLKAWGALVWADEEVGWRGSGRDYDKDDRSTLYTQNVGIVGMPVGMVNGNSNPHYVPT
jgi:hypothetical protein